jgi:hypothetical protein
VWNVYETLSFDLVSSETILAKAHRWESMTRYLKQAEELQITYLLGAPGRRHAQAYGKARQLLENSQARLVEENGAADFATELARRIRAAG